MAASMPSDSVRPSRGISIQARWSSCPSARMRSLGQDDRLAWLLIPLLGLMLSLGMLTAIVHALTPDEKWDAQQNPGHAVVPTGWGAVMAAIVALLIGGAVLMGTIAFSGQKFFEWQLEPAPDQKTSQLTQ